MPISSGLWQAPAPEQRLLSESEVEISTEPWALAIPIAHLKLNITTKLEGLQLRKGIGVGPDSVCARLVRICGHEFSISSYI